MGMNKKGTRIFITALCILLCSAVLSVGIAFGRYTSTVTSNADFKAYDLDKIAIHGITAAADREVGTWMPTPVTWTEAEGIYSLEFSVSNGDSATSFSPVRVKTGFRLTATAGFDFDNTTVSLIALPDDYSGIVPEDAEVYTGVARAVTEASSLYEEIGEGWLCFFYDTDGYEMSFELEGGELCTKNFVLRVSGGASDLSLLRLMLTPVVD